MTNGVARLLVQLIFAGRYLSDHNTNQKLPGYHVSPHSTITFPEQAAKFGYKVEQHTVITDDEYILTMFRIPRGRRCHGPEKGPPVIIMHGVLESADTFIDASPSDGLGYLIADECYDTWLGNARGTFYSRKHLVLDPDTDKEYWQFSVDEMGMYDVPAFIDYVIKVTGAHEVNYLGFSQGGGTFMIMCSERPGYCEKVRLFIGLSPATRHLYSRSLPFRILSKAFNAFFEQLQNAGIWEILTTGFPIQATIRAFCKTRISAGIFCGSLLSVLDLPHPFSITSETLRVGFSHAPAGISLQNGARYGQAVTSEKFVKFDYGPEKNYKVYGTREPPEYDLSKVKVPSVVIQGLNDGIVDPRDSFWAAKQLPNLLAYVKVKDLFWNHFDQTYSQYINETTFPIIKDYLNQYSDNQFRDHQYRTARYRNDEYRSDVYKGRYRSDRYGNSKSGMFQKYL